MSAPHQPLARVEAEVFIACSLDGFIARPGGELDWLMQAQASAPPCEDFGYAAFMQRIDALVMGRHTLETVAGFAPWPYDRPVIAMTRTPLRAVPPGLQGRVQWSSEPLAALLARLAVEGLQRVYLDGGALIQSALHEDLVDRLIVTQVPVLLGQGRRLWGPLPRDLTWTLEGVQHWPNGFVQTHHRRQPDRAVPHT